MISLQARLTYKKGPDKIISMPRSKEEIRKYYSESPWDGFLGKIKDLFLHPGKFFESVKGEGLKPAFVMFIVFFLISNVVSTALQPPSLLNPLASLISILIVFALNFFFFALMHIFVMLLGGKKGIKQTFKALMYASVPITIVSTILGSAAFGFVGAAFNVANLVSLLNPAAILAIGILILLSVVIFVWSIYLQGLGLGKLHGISTARGIVAAIIAPVILIVITAVLAGITVLWGSSLTTSATSAVEKQIEEQLTETGKMIRIDSLAGTTLNLRNVGTQTVQPSELGFFINGVATTCSGLPAIAPDAVGTCTLSASCAAGDRLRITAPARPDEVAC